MPEELFVLLLFVVVCVTAITLTRMLTRKTPGEEASSLTAGDLQQLVREAVEDALAPLEARIEALDARQARLSEPAAEPPRVLPAPGERAEHTDAS